MAKKMTRVSVEDKLAAVEACLQGKTNPFQAGKALGVGRGLVYYWLENYKKYGPDGLQKKHYRPEYSDEFKLKAVKDYLAGGKTLSEVQRKHNISGPSVLKDWIEEYNRYGNFYGVWGGTAMTRGSAIGFEERLQIVMKYISDGKSCIELAHEHNVTYQQVRTWVRKYEEKGAAGLEDRRGKRTADQTPRTPEEELKVRIAQLERENYLLTVERDLLKKANEFERGDL